MRQIGRLFATKGEVILKEGDRKGGRGRQISSL